MGNFKDTILDENFKKRIRGVTSVVDWVLCDVRDFSTIDNLVKRNKSFSTAKKIFAKTKEDAELFDKWAINKIAKGF